MRCDVGRSGNGKRSVRGLGGFVRFAEGVSGVDCQGEVGVLEEVISAHGGVARCGSRTEQVK